MVEAIWGEHKSADQIARISTALLASDELVLATRVSAEKAAAVKALLPGAPAGAPGGLRNGGRGGRRQQ